MATPQRALNLPRWRSDSVPSVMKARDILDALGQALEYVVRMHLGKNGCHTDIVLTEQTVPDVCHTYSVVLHRPAKRGLPEITKTVFVTVWRL